MQKNPEKPAVSQLVETRPAVDQEITNRCHVTVLYFLLILYMFRTRTVSETCRELTGNKVL
jgi:hypothetical protein